MRTTLDIDADVLEAVKERARREGTTAGKWLSDLVRQILTGSGKTQAQSLEHGFKPLASRGGIVTSEQVNRIRDEEGI